MRPLVTSFAMLLVGSLGAVELPGIPAAGGIGSGTWRLAVGNDGLGPGGGGASDDFRTGHVGLNGDSGRFAVAADFSLLTIQNPSGAPVFWGFSDPFAQRRVGAARSDEATIAGAVRTAGAAGRWQGWLQAGPGVQLAGDLHGSSLQNQLHLALGNARNDLPYEHPGLQAAALVHAGLGGRMTIAGPLALDAGAVGLTTIGDWTRWRGELLAVAQGAGGGVWAGVRLDGAGGHALTGTADAVARHESGMGIVVGAAIDLGEVRLGLETAHSLAKDGQDGTVTLAWTPGGAAPVPGPDPWAVRVGLSGLDTRVDGHGFDLAVGTVPEGWPTWLYVVCGLRDQRISTPYTFDISGQRLLLWTGLAAEPVVAAGAFGAITVRGEAGIGWRRASIETHGFLDVDGGTSHTSDALIARLAAGVGGRFATALGTLGVMLLIEASAAPERSALVSVHDPLTPSVIREQREVPLDGSSLGGLIGITATCSW
jgi:hypothetical protein